MFVLLWFYFSRSAQWCHLISAHQHRQIELNEEYDFLKVMARNEEGKELSKKTAYFFTLFCSIFVRWFLPQFFSFICQSAIFTRMPCDFFSRLNLLFFAQPSKFGLRTRKPSKIILQAVEWRLRWMCRCSSASPISEIVFPLISIRRSSSSTTVGYQRGIHRGWLWWRWLPDWWDGLAREAIFGNHFSFTKRARLKTVRELINQIEA